MDEHKHIHNITHIKHNHYDTHIYKYINQLNNQQQQQSININNKNNNLDSEVVT